MSLAKQHETQMPSSLVWSHATNSLSALQAVLDPASKVNFVEADVVQPPSDDDAAEPIMAYVVRFMSFIGIPTQSVSPKHAH